ncbi:sugar nucleotide-binding protein [Bacillus sp. 165]|uniref:sugar nucleotide-binding protein n=1 Tax=Bacillus sp. 165 TaxID=1529117 RepID=UPI001ADA7A35|nr:sugar nucleotide-binding protein [Bacillus sp. 165]MBO9131484.1 sugar nucleotide-binding protein [Bacillus sp. 165]
MKKVLILGASGLIGRAIIEEFARDYDIYGTYNQSSIALPLDKQFQLKVDQQVELEHILQRVQPDIVISSLRGEFQQQQKFHQHLVSLLRLTDARLYFLSTTNVFDGDDSKLHTEKDTPIPFSEYGKFKVQCESIIQYELQDRGIIIRLPQVWGTRSPRFNQIKEQISKKEAIPAYRNLIRTSLLDVTLAKQLRFIIEKELLGVFHLTTYDAITDENFIIELLHKLKQKEIPVQQEYYKDAENTYYFGLQSIRTEIPKHLQQTNADIMGSLVQR